MRSLLLGVACALATGCGGDSKPQPTARGLSVLLVTLDTTRANALGAYGNPLGPTPALDAIARESVLYERARTVAPLTVPAHASMLTGLYPPRHTLVSNWTNTLPASASTLAERAKAAGVQTAAFVSGVVLDPWMGLSQGFDVYRSPPREVEQQVEDHVEYKAPDTVGAAREWLAKRDRDAPFLAWIHLFDAHSPYEPPADLKERYKSAYLGEVAFMDQSLGELFAELRADGTLSQTLVIVVADHGENLGQHGEPSHGWYVYEGTIHVPMFVRYPDAWRAGQRSDEVVSVVDVFPTALAALGLEVPTGIDGVSLYRAFAPQGRGVYFECFNGFLCFGWSPIVGWADASAKYIHSTEPELYDVAGDKQERKNLATARAADAERYKRAIAILRGLPALAAEAAPEADESMHEALRSLGYVGVDMPTEALPDPLAPSDLPSPRARRGELELYYEALEQGELGKRPEAVDLMRTLLQQYPGNRLARTHLAAYLVRLERYAEARPVLEELLAGSHPRAADWNRLGWCREQLDDLKGAADAYEAALALDGTYPFAKSNLERVRKVLDGR